MEPDYQRVKGEDELLEEGDAAVPSSFYASRKGGSWFPRSYTLRRRLSVGGIVALFLMAGILASLGLGSTRGHLGKRKDGTRVFCEWRANFRFS